MGTTSCTCHYQYLDYSCQRFPNFKLTLQGKLYIAKGATSIRPLLVLMTPEFEVVERNERPPI